ncbi:MAG TPA: glycoside hydrolase family 13 protein [Anaerolineales bacterium]|nr:glycoside hydrolase family 13 protein [Anaerolineales bacterium]
MSVPSWVQDAVFYQIFPDRFANGDPANDPADVQPWGSPPTNTGFQGGDLRGIADRLDYLTDLGVTAIWLNPIFAAGSNHRYNTADFRAIDDRLGSDADFTRLVDEVHRRGMRLLLDGVFNHTGRGYFAFRDLLDRGEESAYRDWYHVRHFPLDAFGDEPAENYLAWWNIRSLPKLNTDNPSVRAYLMDIARRWIARGADGWRLDVPNEIDDDSFWARFRRQVKSTNEEAYLLGEIWTVDPRWVGPRALDGLMNYPLRRSMLDLVVDGRLDAASFCREVETQVAAYPAENVLAQYNLLGSHDTERVATLAGGDARRVHLLMTLQFTLPGAPAIYYGDEIGLAGDKDPACRGAFPWGPAAWDSARRAWVRHLIEVRRDRPELRRGSLRFFEIEGAESIVAFERSVGPEASIVLANVAGDRLMVTLPRAALAQPALGNLQDLLHGRTFESGEAGWNLSFEPFEAMLLAGASIQRQPPGAA